MRGEDINPFFLNPVQRETPPHAWGRLSEVNHLHREDRKHPHMRGEDPERSLNFFLHTWY